MLFCIADNSRRRFCGASPSIGYHAFEGFEGFEGSLDNLKHYVFAEYYQGFIDAGFTNVVIVEEPFAQPQEEILPGQPEDRITGSAHSFSYVFNLSGNGK